MLQPACFESVSTAFRFLQKRYLGLNAAKRVMALIRFINSFTVNPVQQKSCLPARQRSALSTTADEEEASEFNYFNIFEMARSRIKRKREKAKIVRNYETFFCIVCRIQQQKFRGGSFSSLISLDLLYAPWDIHYGRLWSRRNEISLLIKTVSGVKKLK